MGILDRTPQPSSPYSPGHAAHCEFCRQWAGKLRAETIADCCRIYWAQKRIERHRVRETRARGNAV